MVCEFIGVVLLGIARGPVGIHCDPVILADQAGDGIEPAGVGPGPLSIAAAIVEVGVHPHVCQGGAIGGGGDPAGDPATQFQGEVDVGLQFVARSQGHGGGRVVVMGLRIVLGDIGGGPILAVGPASAGLHNIVAKGQRMELVVAVRLAAGPLTTLTADPAGPHVHVLQGMALVVGDPTGDDAAGLHLKVDAQGIGQSTVDGHQGELLIFVGIRVVLAGIDAWLVQAMVPGTARLDLIVPIEQAIDDKGAIGLGAVPHAALAITQAGVEVEIGDGLARVLVDDPALDAAPR